MLINHDIHNRIDVLNKIKETKIIDVVFVNRRIATP